MSAHDTLAEAIAERQRLVQETKDIQAQMGNRNATDVEGRRIPAHEYWEWRHRAVHALRAKERRMAELKAIITAERQRASVATAGNLISGPVTAESLLASLAALVRRLASEGVDLDPEEQALLDAAQHLLVHGPAKGGAR